MFKNFKKSLKRAIIFILSLGVVVVIVITLTNLYGDKIFQKKTIKVWIDSDSGRQVDNLFAIARVFMEPRMEVLGLSSVQRELIPQGRGRSLMESCAMNDSLLRLFQISEVPHPTGAADMMRFADKPIAVKTSAADQLILAAKKFSKKDKLNLLCMGPLTNIASAVLMDPEIIPLISIYINTMYYDSKTKVWNKNEVNARNDLDALDILLNTEGLEIFVMPVNLSEQLFLNPEDMYRYISGREGAWKFLFTEWSKQNSMNNQISMDALAMVEAIIDPELARIEQLLSPPENKRRTLNVITSINKELMAADFWAVVNKYNRKNNVSD